MAITRNVTRHWLASVGPQYFNHVFFVLCIINGHIIFDIPASVKSLKNYVTGSRKTFNDKVHLFFLTPLVPGTIHAFMNVFLSGIHSRLRTGFKDLPFSLARFSSSSFLFFLNCAPDGFCIFIISFVEVAWTHTLTTPLNVLACAHYTTEVRTPSSFDFWLILHTHTHTLSLSLTIHTHTLSLSLSHYSYRHTHSLSVFFCLSPYPPTSPPGNMGSSGMREREREIETDS